MAKPHDVGALLLDQCEQLPGAELGFPFGPQPAVFKVGGKIFAFFTGPDGAMAPRTAADGDLSMRPDRMSVKCDPDFAAALVREHAAITPGYHLNKRHWVSVDLTAGPSTGLPDGLAEELLVDSYDLVVHALARARRPVGLPAAANDPDAPRAVRPGSGTASPDRRPTARRRRPG
jgi:predicted DNA-binding protein (MmcQ/YjbR family)